MTRRGREPTHRRGVRGRAPPPLRWLGGLLPPSLGEWSEERCSQKERERRLIAREGALPLPSGPRPYVATVGPLSVGEPEASTLTPPVGLVCFPRARAKPYPPRRRPLSLPRWRSPVKKRVSYGGCRLRARARAHVSPTRPAPLRDLERFGGNAKWEALTTPRGQRIWAEFVSVPELSAAAGLTPENVLRCYWRGHASLKLLVLKTKKSRVLSLAEQSEHTSL